ncbi:MAG: tetratricopeptide repeat protein [Myxococcaceae bacterium]
MIRLSSVLVLSALFLGCSEAGSTEIARGNVLASQKKFDDAIAAYRAASQAAPSRARPRELLGHVLFDRGDLAGARAAYVDALKVEPKVALEARIGLARLDAEEGKLDDALKGMQDVLQEQPKNVYALLSRATLELRRGAPGDVDQAILDTAQAMAVDEKNPSVLYTRGCAFLGAKDYDKAAEAFALLEKQHPTSPLPAYGRARIAGAKAEKLQALSNLELARSKAAQFPSGWRAADVKGDPAFAQWKEDPEFIRVVGN